MRLPIQYALTYPERVHSEIPRLDFGIYPDLTFEKPDVTTFRNLGLAYEAMNRGGKDVYKRQGQEDFFSKVT